MIGIAITIAYLLIGGYITVVRIDWKEFVNNPDSMDIWFIGFATILVAVMWPFVLIGHLVLKVQSK